MKGTLKLLIPIILFAGACEKLPPMLSVSESEIEVRYTGGELSVSIQSSESWTASVLYEQGREKGWLDLSVTSGEEGIQDLVIRLTENPERRRKATVTITAKTEYPLHETITIWQDGMIDRDMTEAVEPSLAAYWMTQHPTWGRITDEDIQSCTSMTFENIWPGMDFRGLSIFKNLTSIYIRNCELDRLDLSAVPWLKRLYIQDTPLQELELAGNPELESLEIRDVPLRTLDTSHNPHLSTVDYLHSGTTCALEQVILGPGVESFYVKNALEFSSLDCSQASNLEHLYFPNCNIHRLDLSNTKVRFLEVRQNPLDELLLSPTLESLNINMCTGQLASLTLGSQVNKIVITCSTLSELNVDAAQSLSWLECSNNRLPRLDISRIPLPEYLNFGGNPGVDGIFELIVAPDDYETAKQSYDGWSWEADYTYEHVVTKVIKG